MKFMLLVATAALLCAPCAWSTVIGEVDGVPIEDGYSVDGTKLLLNGAGVRKRAYFKTDVSAIYLTEPRNTLEGIESAPGAKRLQVVAIKNLPGSTVSRYFIADFQAVATEAEFKQLINEIGVLGEIYSKIRQVNKGDVFNIDWTPGKGVHSTVNGKPLVLTGNNVSPYLNNELLYRVMLRMYIKASGSAEMRDNLLGRSRSMLNTTTAEVNPPRTP